MPLIARLSLSVPPAVKITSDGRAPSLAAISSRDSSIRRRASRPVGHFHAAVFSHRTLPIGEIDLKATVAALFEAEHLQGVLHLLGDYREPAGLGESEFILGACWAAPLRW